MEYLQNIFGGDAQYNWPRKHSNNFWLKIMTLLTIILLGKACITFSFKEPLDELLYVVNYLSDRIFSL